MDEFSVSRRRAGDAVVVVPVGEIDLATVDAAGGPSRPPPPPRPQHLVLDLREVSFIDSAGLRLVLESSRAVDRFERRARPAGGQRVFDLVGLDERL